MAAGSYVRALPESATFFLAVLVAITLAATGPFLSRLFTGGEFGEWQMFALLAGAATLAQAFGVPSGRSQTYHTSYAFFIAAALLLPPELMVLVAIVANIPEGFASRHPWYVQAFNICNYTLNTLCAWGAFVVVREASGLREDVAFALGGLAAAVAFTSLNHFLLAVMLRVGRGIAFRETGLFSIQSLSVDFVLPLMGVSLAAFWESNPWLIPFALAPIFIVQRVLSMPQLEVAARVDPKTGLYNTRYFTSALSRELTRAERLGRPVSLMMADLDFLRDINNTYGHLAGDAVIQGIAAVLRQQLRPNDVPARFGGEEFSILLPNTPLERALEIAESIRRAVADHEYSVETARTPIRATISIGLAGFPEDATDEKELLHQADLAVYRAKLQGRNRVALASVERAISPAARGSG